MYLRMQVEACAHESMEKHVCRRARALLTKTHVHAQDSQTLQTRTDTKPIVKIGACDRLLQPSMGTRGPCLSSTAQRS